MSVAGPILLVESDRSLGEVLAAQLAADGYRVELARNARHARMLAAASKPRLAILGGLDLPRGALALLEEIRAADRERSCWPSTLPALVLSRTRSEIETLRAFEAGADDFLAMPLGYLELRGFVSSTRLPRISSTGAKIGRSQHLSDADKRKSYVDKSPEKAPKFPKRRFGASLAQQRVNKRSGAIPMDGCAGASRSFGRC